MKKVLYLTNIPAPYKVAFFNELSKKVDLTVGFESFTDPDRKNEWLKREKIKFNHFFLSEDGISSISNAMKNVLNELKKSYDIVVISTYYTKIQKKLISYFKKKRIPYAISSDGGYKKKDFILKKLLKKYYLSGAKYYFSPSEITDEYLKYYGAKTEIYRYPFTSVTDLDIKDYLAYDKGNVLKLKEELNIKEEKVVVGVGSFIHRKGWDILINSIRDKTIGYYIIGGCITKEYKQLIEERKLSNIHFLEFMDKQNVFKYYRIADLFCLPTREDIWGLVINEALANGLPVVTSNMCLAGLELIDGTNGILFDVKKENCFSELNEAIMKILYSPDYYIYKENAFKTARKYTIENMADTYSKVFNLY